MESEIIISGIAGKYPESENLEEFWKNLYDGVDMISEDNRRWNVDAYDMPKRMGKVRNLEKFDADYFGVHGKQVNAMDPKIRMTLEVTHEAMMDAGVNPYTVRGSRTGVFAGAGSDEANSIWQRSSENPSGYINLGSACCMVANRVSFAFDIRGPSYAIDSACSASCIALQNAFFSIKHGVCEAAVVSGTQISFDPHTTLGLHNLGMNSWEGKCRVFDASPTGYVRSEAVVVLYVCKKEKAKRSYATIIDAKCNSDGYKSESITFPAAFAQEQLAREVYRDCGVSPLDVGYIEAHGTGTRAGDKAELTGLANVFCEGREGPLLVGSVKSNMGHTEWASGLCGISKVLLAHHFGILPANLHFTAPNPEIPSLLDGRIKVVAENTVFNERYAALNSFGYGGSNVHVLLELTPKKEVLNMSQTLPVLVPVSGRTSEAVKYFLEKLSAQGNNNRNAVALVHEIFKARIPRYNCRGYALLGAANPEISVHEQPNPAQRPIWYVFTGLGSQWTGMFQALMAFKVFQQSILTSEQILLTKSNYKLLEIEDSGEPEAALEFKNAMVSITAIQVALVELLACAGVEPDGIVGHSNGEVASGYADGCFSQEQAVLVSLGRARAFIESNLPPATVAAVGLTWEEATRRCPPGIFPAIHNSANNVTIAGPPEPIHDFVKQLKSEGTLAKMVQSAVCGFHSPYVKDSEKIMRELLGKVIPEPKKRSRKWLSSSVPEDKWDSELAKYPSVDYNVNNALSPVYFYETLQHVPEDAIVLEIGPNCFMQSILKQALPPTTAKLGLMSKHTDDNPSYFLNALGKLYLEGGSIDVSKLYDPVEFPVGPETPIISPWVKWDHSQTWNVPDIRNEMSKGISAKYTIDLANEADSFYKGHTIDGRVIFPGTGYIVLVWKTLALAKGMTFEMLPVVFEQLRFERSTLLSIQKPTELVVSILSDFGEFEVTVEGVAACRGRVRTPVAESIEDEMLDSSPRLENELPKPFLTGEDCYKELRIRGYEYSKTFQGIHSFCMERSQGLLEWQDNWVVFLDTMLQASLIPIYQRGLYLPIRIEKVSIGPQKFKQHLDTNPLLVPLTVSKTLGTIQCPGIEVRGAKVKIAPRRFNREIPTITELKFLPYFDDELHTFNTALDFCIGIVMDNTQGDAFVLSEHSSTGKLQSVSSSVSSQCVAKFKFLEFRFAQDSNLLKTDSAHEVPAISKLMSTAELKTLKPCHLLYLDSEKAIDLKDLIAPKGFLLINAAPSTKSRDIDGFIRIALKNTENCKLTLYRSSSDLASIACSVTVEPKDFSWVDTLKNQLANHPNERVVIVSGSATGIIGLVKCLIRERGITTIRAVSVESGGLEIDFAKEPLSSQLKNDLVFNVYQNGVWGSYVNLVIPIDELQTPQNSSEAYANASITGDLSSLKWIESPLKLAGAEDKRICKIFCAALNFRDIMLATGKLSKDALPEECAFDDCVLGIEYSGVLDSKRVMGLCPSRCMATKVLADPLFVWDIPESWSFEDAATVPVAYATAIYALVVRGDMQPGESVLVHAGSGGLGLAAITVALKMGSTVYTTVGTKEKREFLKARFPQLQDHNITDSRNARVFEKHIKEQTQGRGVDLVLNSLSQEKFHASIRCLAKHGRFLEVGKFDLFEDTAVGMSVMLKSVNIQGILIDNLIDKDAKYRDRVANLVKEGLKSGLIQPLPFTVFSHEHIEDAFRYMAGGKHMGKVLVNLADGGLPSSLPRTYFHPHKSYVLIGGLGGMGLEIANWMIERGCRNLVLNSRAGAKNSYQQHRIDVFRKLGAAVIVDRSEVANPEGATSVLEKAVKLGPIGGIFNMALLLQDALFENQTPDHFKATSKAKILATSELDRVSRVLAPELDYFVAFSSIAASRGNPGQTNYGYANSLMERICEQRRRDGLPGLAIQWGLIDDVGAAFGNLKLHQDLKALGMAPQKMSSWLSTLDVCLRQESRTILGSFIQEAAASDLKKEVGQNSLASGVAHILGITDLSKINPHSTLFDLGMDSLMASEIRQLLSIKVGDLSALANTPGQLRFSQIIAMEGSVKSPEVLDRKQKLYPFPKTTIRKLKSLEQAKDTIFIVHPTDGSLNSIETLISHLDATVYGIEGIREAPLTSLECLAKSYVNEMKKFQPDGPYKLAGYSFGGAVAFEMALQLEQEGSVVDSLLFLDSCPRWKQMLSSELSSRDLKEDLTSCLVHFLTCHLRLDPKQVEGDLVALNSWDDRVAHAAKLLKGVYTDFDLEELKDLTIAFSYRTMMVFYYEPTGKIKCRTMLIKCMKGMLDKHLNDDYNINEFCLNPPVEITAVEGTHYCFIEEPLELGIPEIINGMYSKKNIKT